MLPQFPVKFFLCNSFINPVLMHQRLDDTMSQPLNRLGTIRMYDKVEKPAIRPIMILNLKQCRQTLYTLIVLPSDIDYWVIS